MKKVTVRIFTAVLALAAFCVVGCSKKETAIAKPQEQPAAKTEPAVQTVHYKDGTYHAFTDIKDDWGGNAEITITITDGKITACEFLSYDKDGKLKGEDYGKTDGVIKNAGLYKIAQAALAGAAQYGQKLIQTQQPDMVDAVAGATVSHELFQNAAGIALRQAKAAN
ncbi:FMN-binding protein [Treponema sp.]|uniref:FMN-binding protein n=1 Tax=Treponema sp. TaxID=166 RepID=UPI003FA336AE